MLSIYFSFTLPLHGGVKKSLHKYKYEFVSNLTSIVRNVVLLL